VVICGLIFRASKLLNDLQKEEFDKLKNGRSFPQIKPGDSIEVHQLPHMTSNEIDVIKGVVIGVTKKNSDTAVKLLNVSPLFLEIFISHFYFCCRSNMEHHSIVA
jgi:ribosomal protein L19